MFVEPGSVVVGITVTVGVYVETPPVLLPPRHNEIGVGV